MAFYGISVEEGLKSLGLFEDFEEKIKNISEEYIQDFTQYIDELQSYSEWLDSYQKTVLSVNKAIKNRQTKIKATDKELKNNGGLWNNLKGRRDVYTTETGYNRAKAQVTDLLAESHQNTNDTLSSEDINKHIIGLHYLEEKIMGKLYELNILIKGHRNPVTEEYAIYFHGEKHNRGYEVNRGEISSNDQAFKDSLYADLEGNLQLSFSITKKLSAASVETIANFKDSSNTNSVYQEYIEGLITEVSTFYSNIVNRGKQLLKEGSKQHLGGEKDSELDASLSAYAEQDIVLQIIDQHQQALRNFLYNNESNKILTGDRVNRGHLAEAFERLYQAHKEAQPNGPQLDYATAVQESLQNDPWYTQPDAGKVSVKSFLDRNDRQVASFSSLKNLCKNLLLVLQAIVRNEKENINKLNKTAEWWIKQKQKELEATNKKVKEDYDKLAEDFIKSSIETLNNQIKFDK